MRSISHLPGVAETWTDCGRIAILICYDIEFPEVARAHAESGTDILFVPTGLMAPFEVVSNILVPARAYENQLYVAYVNRCDVEAELRYCGLSCAISPDGTALARAAGQLHGLPTPVWSAGAVR